MEAEDLASLVLQLYDARKEAKDYLEFFLNPDINAKYVAAEEECAKELQRTLRHHYCPRVSRIKAAVKHFASYGPDDDMVCGLMTTVFEMMCKAANDRYFAAPFGRGCVTFLGDTLKRVEKAGLTSHYFGRLTAAVDSLSTKHTDSRQLRTALRDVIEGYRPDLRLQ